MKKRHFSKLFSSGYLILILLFIYLPIGYLILFSFNEGKSMTNFSGFSLRWYENLFQNESSMLESVWTTLLVAGIATLVSTVVGTVAAIGLSKAKRVVRSVVLEINTLPVMNPDIVTAIGLMLLFISVKVQPSMVTLILSHISFCIPYVILTIMPKLRQLDDNVAEAALDLGATPWKALTKVIIPQIYPADRLQHVPGRLRGLLFQRRRGNQHDLHVRLLDEAVQPQRQRDLDADGRGGDRHPHPCEPDPVDQR